METIRAADKTKPVGVRCPLPFKLAFNVSGNHFSASKQLFFFFFFSVGTYTHSVLENTSRVPDFR